MSVKRVVSVALLFLIASAASAAANEGGSLYKTKCSGCHGVNGEGKPAVKAPALKGTAMEVDQIVQHILKGDPGSKPPHNKGISGLTEDQAKSIAEHVKTLK